MFRPSCKWHATQCRSASHLHCHRLRQAASKYGLGTDFAKWATAAGLPAHCRLHGLKKGGMRRLAEDGNTTHELMAISGHRTLTEVQRYTDDANRKLLAKSGMAKKRAQSKNTNVTNIAAPLHKHAAKALKTKG